MPLPIDDTLPALLAALATHRRAVLEAPPGAGKTTGVPLALLEAPWLGSQQILLLEPRRLAARAAARRMAALRGERVGETIGFVVRGEHAVGPRTRVLVVTEGILTRRLQQDPALEGVGAVLFDEFHERSLIADTGLALVLGATSILRDDLAVLVMSATLDGARVAALLGNAPRITSEGRAFPVTTRFVPPRPDARLEDHVARTVREALADEIGSQLVFLPGAGEIRRVEERLAGTLPANVDLYPLHGSLPPAQQDAAIAPSPPGRRKVVLATNVAETSLTIDGVRVVIDSGLARVPRFSPRTGMTRLETVRVTRASADQRRGRAGRTEPGVCLRCWHAAEDAGLIPDARAEILDADLAPLVLDLAAAGFTDPGELPWLDAPPAAAWQQGRELLQLLGALDGHGRLTPHGTAMSELGTAPRLAHMLVRARDHGAPSLARAAALAALLEERDPMRGAGGPPPSDVRLRLDALERDGDATLLGGATLDRGALARLRELAATWRQRLGNPRPDPRAADEAGMLLADAFPDRVARRRDAAGRFVLRSGRGATLPEHDPLAQASWLVAVALDDAGRDARITLAAPLDDAAVEAILSAEATTSDEVTWDATQRAVVARRVTRLGAIEVRSHAMASPDPSLVRDALLAAVRAEGLDLLPWSDAARSLRARLAFVHHHDAAWPDVGDAALLATLDGWLGPHLDGVRRVSDLQRVDLGGALLAMLSWDRRAALERLAPERIQVPSGSRLAVDYADPEAPVLAVRLQEVFGLAATPRVMDGRVPVVLQLLSPAYRPVQVTRDLASFWQTGYFDVRKDLRGRYPKHRWPDDPLEAEPGMRRPR
jgi:ATP-dependent helicase HrpB